MKFVIALAFAAPLFAQCTYVVDPLSFAITAAGSPGSVHVTQTPGSACGSYTATTQTPWLHITSPVSGIPGDSGVDFIADANLGAAPRAGTMSIALHTVTVTQAGANCAFSMTPTSQNFPVGGGDNTFQVTANCAWQATSNVNWITLNANNGISSIPVSYSVAANTCVAARNGSITLQQTNLANPPALAVTQDGSPGNISLSPSSTTAPAAASDGRFTVTTGDVCNWSASTDVNWIRITVPANGAGTGNGGISYHLLDNTTAQRTGHIIVGPLTYTITQLAPGPPPVVLSSVANAANYNADAVSPGEIVALFGTNMGPASIVTLQVDNGTVTNSLAGTQVLFDGVAAPMVYTLKGQVSAVVPYGVAGKTNTQVQVSYQGNVSNTLPVPVRAATPAVFSLDSTGIGPGAILNQDLSVNSTGNPAARLSIIALYCTGGGVTTPASPDGAVIGVPPPVLSQTPVVTVSIGGVNAAVKFAGAAPGAVAGLTQINVEVPAGLTPSLALPVIVKIGDFTSTGSVTVSVK
jgi:trimeric autotransporter adhesin